MPTAVATVLVADDDCFVRETVKVVLEQNGYIVRQAADGEAALASLAAVAADIVLLDIMMPRKEGLETLLELKRSFPNVTVYVMSASGGHRVHDFLAIAAKFGADATLQKPFSPAELLSLVRSGVSPRVSAAPATGVR